jgi:benzoyl-CoA-dihydrodiol lyase
MARDKRKAGRAMAHEVRNLANGATRIDFATDPSRYRHWNLTIDGVIAALTMDVDEAGGLFEGYALKLNSYDLGVDIELADALRRLGFEHPAVKVVVLRSAKPRVFCAGANIRMLAGAEHPHKVNFCKFTNETRNAMEDASASSDLRFLCVVNGGAAGGGYELALATDHIMLVDDGSSAVSLPELPLLAVLPGTGGLTRLVDKRKVRRDHADVLCTVEEGVKGQRALDWRLVDELAPFSQLGERAAARANALAAGSRRAGPPNGVALTPLDRSFADDGVRYRDVSVDIDRAARLATITMRAAEAPPPAGVEAMIAQGAAFWPLRLARELDDAILHLRNNEYEIGVLIFKSAGDPALVALYDAFLEAHRGHWLVHEVRHYWKRVLKRIDVTSRSLVAVVEPGSCFAGFLAEIVFAADRAYMLIGRIEGDNRPPAALTLTAANFGPYPMANGLTRLATRFFGEPRSLDEAAARRGEAIDARRAETLGLVTFALDDIDWSDELRLFVEERASFSPDALTGMEANLRFPGPETMESKIFARLTAWQNWIFQRPNAAGEDGALRRYGSGRKPGFDLRRV